MDKQNSTNSKRNKILFYSIAIFAVLFITAIVIFNSSSSRDKKLVGVQSIENLKQETGCTQNNLTEAAKCISEKTTLYTQLGCHACQEQEEMFGDDYQYLNAVDCYTFPKKCMDNKIRATPTWVIKDGN